MRGLALAALLFGCAHARHPACSGTLPLGDGVGAELEPTTAREGVIDSVTVNGGEGLAPIVMPVVESKPGQLVADAPIGEDVRRLWALGLFRDVQVTAQPTGQYSILAHERRPRIALAFELVPRVLVSRVRVEGGGAHDPELRRMHWIGGLPYEPRRLARMAQAIELAYVRDGRLDAKIAVRRAAGPGVALCVAAEPGPRVTIGKLTFPGRRAIGEKELVSVMHGKGVNHVGEIFDAEALELDRLYILDRYYERGMINARISDPRTKRRGKHLDVEIPIDEGPVFHLGALRMENGLPAPKGLARGELFVRSRVTTYSRALEERLGYGASAWPISHVDLEARRVDLTWHVEWSWPWGALNWLRLL